MCLYKHCQEDIGTHKTTWQRTLIIEYRKLWYGYNSNF